MRLAGEPFMQDMEHVPLAGAKITPAGDLLRVLSSALQRLSHPAIKFASIDLLLFRTISPKGSFRSAGCT